MIIESTYATKVRKCGSTKTAMSSLELLYPHCFLSLLTLTSFASIDVVVIVSDEVKVAKRASTCLAMLYHLLIPILVAVVTLFTPK